MRLIAVVLCFVLLALQNKLYEKQEEKNQFVLWYTSPASIWEEALPIGNGKTGAMVFGGATTARYQLNDLTLWSGVPGDYNNPEGPEVLKKTRAAVFSGEYLKAASEWKNIHGPYSARYQPLGDLMMKINSSDTTVSEYKRSLDISKAIASEEFTIDGKNIIRESFISKPDRVMVIRVAEKSGKKIRLNALLSSKHPCTVTQIDSRTLALKGKAPWHVAHRDNDPVGQVLYSDEDGKGITYEIRLRIVGRKGRLTFSNGSLTAEGLSDFILLLSTATSYNGFDKTPYAKEKDPSEQNSSIIGLAESKGYRALREDHIKDFTNLFNRCELNLAGNSVNDTLPTDERLFRYKRTQKDNTLEALYFMYGRYLMISGSRDQDMPMNLQGIWNQHIQPPWGSNYTTNINTEMNYWPSEITNLSECSEPLFSFIGNLSENGARTASVCFGLPGWCCFHNSDIWAKTSPPGGGPWDSRASARWSCWPMAGAWFSQHLYRHYEFTGDMAELRDKAWPVMKGAAEFILGWLTSDSTGYLVTNPSTSPENVFRIGSNTFEISKASTMDMAIARDLFSNCIKAAEVLGTDEEFRKKLETALSKLYPYQIGRYGQLQEWFNDVDDPKDNHRHISHLFGLYPGNEITPERTPELASAAVTTLKHRGDASTGWSMAWKINWWARLGDGDHAHKLLREGLTYIGPKDPGYKGGGTYPNLFDGHPPFQIDGNLGGTAGIAEMLVQSHEDNISLLPALPSAWTEGEVRGLKTRGNFTVSIKWKNGQMESAEIHSALGGNCRLKTGIAVTVNKTVSVPAVNLNPNKFFRTPEAPPFINNSKTQAENVDSEKSFIIDFMTEAGKSYKIVPSTAESK